MTTVRATAALLVAVALVGCALPDEQAVAWARAPTSHTCSFEQMGKVQAETLWCKENVGYNDRYCYGAAIIRNCSPRGAHE